MYADRPQITIWRMRIACWMPEATDTLRLCNTYCFSTATMVTRKRRNVTLYVHCLSCYIMLTNFTEKKTTMLRESTGKSTSLQYALVTLTFHLSSSLTASHLQHLLHIKLYVNINNKDVRISVRFMYLCVMCTYI